MGERDFYQRYNIGVVLLFALKLQQIVISAARRVREFAANQRTRVINSTLAGFRIQKCAGLAEYRISLAPQNPFFSD